MDKKEFITELREKRLTYQEIGAMLGITRQRVHQIDAGYKSPSQITSTKKEEIKKGIRLDTKGLGHLKGRDMVREAVRRRDNYQCQICLKKWKKTQRRFDVHHLNGLCGKKSKGYDKVTDGNVLITLCHKCHLNLHSVRNKMVNGKKLAKKAVDKSPK